MVQDALSLLASQGYPGSLTTRVTYRLEGQSLKLTIDADTDKATPVNITQHRHVFQQRCIGQASIAAALWQALVDAVVSMLLHKQHCQVPPAALAGLPEPERLL